MGIINPLLPIYRRRERLHVLTVAQPKVLCTPALYRDHDHLAGVAGGHRRLGLFHGACGDRRGASPRQWGRFTTPLCGSPTRWPVTEVAEPQRRARSVREDERPDMVSELIFTSGTEATPKAIMHTEETANFSVRVARQDLGLDDRDVVWMPSPVGHSTGFNYGVRLAIYHGLALLLQDRWDAAVACDLIAGFRASYTLASTTFLCRIWWPRPSAGEVITSGP